MAVFTVILLAAQIAGGGGGRIGAPTETGPVSTPVAQTQPQSAEPQKKAALSGQIVSLTGEPIRKAEVTLQRLDSPNPMAMAGGVTTATDASGNFTFAELEPGRYNLLVNKAGYV